MTLQNRVSLIVICWFLASILIALSALTGAATAQNPVPVINQPLVPDAIAPGSAGFTLTVNGTGFTSGAVVSWNGSARTTAFVSTSRLTSSILSTDVAKAATASVTVVNPTPGGGRSNVVFFQITAPSPTIALKQSNISGGTITERDTTGDFNGDGKLDLAVQDPNGVFVLLGNGNGTFQAPVLNPIPGGSVFLTVGDFNGDGKLDIAALGNGIVAILLGNGDGTFQPHIDSPIDTSIQNPFWLAAGDLNRDGKLDLVVGYQGGSAVSVLLGKGDGTFDSFVNYATAAEPTAVTIGDFNGDGKLDLATANFGSFGGNTVSILLGNGDGTFKPHVEYPTDGAPLSIVAADFNGDGKLDLAVDCSCGHSSPCGRPGTVSILLGNGDGTFRPPVNYDADEFPYTITAGDFNVDGKLDLALTDLDSGKISFLLGKGDGTFQPHFELTTNARPVGLVTGDFNRDGALDLVVGGSNPEVVALMLQIPIVSLSKTSLTFADQLVETSSASQTVTLSNTSGPTLTINSIAVTGTNATDFGQTHTCGSSLRPGASCTITVTFTPTQIGPRTASVTITDNAAGSPQKIALSGTGVVSGPNATLSRTSLTFATQLVGTTSPAQSLKLSNYGTVTLSITSITFAGADPGDFHQSNTCAGSVPPGASCTISVTFKPTQKGGRTGTLSVTDDAPGSPQAVSLSGTGTVVKLVPTSLTFSCSSSCPPPAQTVTLTNTGSTTLTLSISITGTNPTDFSQTNNCGTSTVTV